MDTPTIVALSVAALALLLALAARSKAAEARGQLDDLRRELLVAKEAKSDDLEPKLEGLRKLVALMAAGKPVDPEMVKENRLFRNVSPAKLKADVDAGQAPHIIDVRTPQEWQAGHIASALHIPVEQLEKRLHEVPRDGRTLVVHCAGGGRSAQAAEYLSNRGYLNVFNLEGGLNSWRGEIVRGA